ncbi:tape measure protein [uncultured Eubacterium sp.]|uniref:tape measure protein n=1 Tax=uncultured Eubacterium sp. TaxID=165185 RepID=UPI002598143B|nr:tape measure protein [uncultured Eubacterium sp.]
MSKQVDERVVEMRFDNQNFEKNVATSMSTLDKLKQKLNLKGAGKSLEEINKSAQNVSFQKMADSLSVLEKRFSTTGIVGMSVINNLTNSAMGFVKKLNSFVVSGIKTGGINRAMKIENARFQLGVLLKDSEKVEAVMQNVQTAVDGTAYGMDAAATIASQLAASGMQAGEQMQHSLQAVAGVAAMTNSSYEDIGRIFAQISGQGRLMGNDLLQLSGRGMNAAATLGEALGKTEAEVRDMVSKGQISFQMFSDAMYQAFGEGSKKANESMNGAFANVKSALAKIGADFVSPLVAQNGPIVKFLNAVREKINDIRKITTPLAKTLSGKIGTIIEKFAGLVSKIDISGIMNKFKSLFNNSKFQKASDAINRVVEATEAAKRATQDLGDVVDKVINGDFGNAPVRWQKLTEAGYDWAYVQNLVNEKLGSSVRHATDFQESQNGLIDTQGDVIDQLLKMSDAELANVGFTEDEIESFKELKKQAEKTGIPIKDLMSNVDQLSAKFLILDSFKNIGSNLVKFFQSIGQAFKETFKPKDTDGILYNLIAGFHKLTTKLKMSDSTADKLKRTFKGVFSVISIVGNVVGSAVKHVAKGVSSLYNSFNPSGSNKSILDLTANLGDKLSELKVKLVDEGGIDKAFDKVGDKVKIAADAIKKFISYIKDVHPIKKFGTALQNINFKNVGKNVKDLLVKFAEFTKLDKIADKLKRLKFGEIAKNLIEGFKNGIEENAHVIPEIFIKIGEALLTAIKGVLGIHSPSTETYAIGQNTIAGLVNGIRDGKYKVTDALAELGEHVKNFLQQLPWRQILSLSIIAGLTYTGKRILDVLDKFAAPFEGVGAVLKSVSGVVGKFGSVLDQLKLSMDKFVKAKAFNLRMDGILKFIESIAIVCGLVIAMAQFDPKKLTQGWLCVAATVAIIVMAAAAMDKMSSTSAKFEKGKGFNVKGMKAGLIAIGATVLLIASAIKMVGKLNQDQAKRGFAGLGLILGSILAVIYAASTVSQNVSLKDIVVIGTLMKQLAVALLLMAVSLKLVSTIDDPGAVKKAVTFVGLFTGFVIAIAKLGTSKEERHIAQLGRTLIAISVSMLLMVAVMKAVSRLNPDEIGKGITFMIGFAGFVAILALVTRSGKNGTAKLGGILLSVSLSMILMIGVIKLIARLDPADVAKGIAFMILFVAFVGLLNLASRISKDKQIANMSRNLIGMSVAIGILAGICVLLGFVDAGALAKGIIVVGFLSLFMAGMMKAAGIMSKGNKDALVAKQQTRSLIAMVVAIGLLAAAVVALSLIPTEKLVAATAALSAVMWMMTMMMLASKNIGTQKGNTGGIVSMIVMLGLVGTVMYTLAQLPWEQSLAAAAGLSLVMMSLVAAMSILKMEGKLSGSVLTSVILMTVVMAAMALILHTLKDMDPVSAIGNAVALSTLLISLSSCCVILSAVGSTGAAAFVGIGALTALIGAVAGIVVALGALTDKFPKLEEFMNKGIPLLTTIGEALGSFFGGIVKGFSVEATSGLPQIGQNIADFANNLAGINEGALAGAKAAAQVMLLITGAEFADSFLKFLSNGLFGQQDPTDWSDKLSTFGTAVKSFSDSVVGINADAVTAAANCGQVLVELEKAMPRTGGKLQWLIGEKLDLGTFGNNIVDFANALVSFSDTVSGKIDSDAVDSAANAGKVLAELNNALPYSGGKLQWLTGEKDLGNFSDNIGTFGDAIVNFSNAVAGKVDGEAVDAAATAGKALSELNDSLPTEGGFFQKLIGEKDLGNFSDNIQIFGDAIANFSSAVSGKVDVDSVNIAKTAGNAIVELANSLPEEGLFDNKLSLDEFGTEMTTFAECLLSFSGTVSDLQTDKIETAVKMADSLIDISKSATAIDIDGITNFSSVKSIGAAMSQYSDEVKGLKVDKVQTSVSAASTLLGIITRLVDVDYSGINGFNAVTDIGDVMADYSNSVSGITEKTVSGSVSAANKLLDFIKSTSGIDTSGVGSFVRSVSALSKTDFSGFADAFSKQSSTFSSVGGKLADALSKGFGSKKSSLTSTSISIVSAMAKAMRQNYETFTATGKALITKFADGVKGQKEYVASIAQGVATKAKNEIRGKYSDFYTAGTYLVSGFAAGISANSYKAEAKARQMAKNAYKAAKDELDINSPSKVFRRLGAAVPEGFAQGIERFSKFSNRSSNSMAQTAVETARTALSRMTDVLSSDMSNAPTITPVLDLSNVQSGMGTLGTMLNSTSSIGLTANLNAIGSMRAARRQNGTNSDVVTAIKKLGKDIGNMDRNSYNINGITYDQGSDVADAVETLVRAIRIDRRS